VLDEFERGGQDTGGDAEDGDEDEPNAEETSGGGASKPKGSRDRSGNEPDDDPDGEPGGDDDEDDLDGEEFDRKRALSTIRQQRKTEKEQSKRIRALEKQVKDFTKQNQTREEQINSDLEETRTELKTTAEDRDYWRGEVQRFNAMDAFQRQGLNKRQARFAWKDRDEIGVELEFDDKGRVLNAERFVKAARKYDSETYARGSADGEKREEQRESGTGGKGGMTGMIRAAAGYGD
jgi:hypothetical protein